MKFACVSFPRHSFGNVSRVIFTDFAPLTARLEIRYFCAEPHLGTSISFSTDAGDRNFSRICGYVGMKLGRLRRKRCFSKRCSAK